QQFPQELAVMCPVVGYVVGKLRSLRAITGHDAHFNGGRVARKASAIHRKQSVGTSSNFHPRPRYSMPMGKRPTCGTEGIAWLAQKGSEHLQFRLTPDSPTRRVVASCCNSAMLLEFTKRALAYDSCCNSRLGKGAQLRVNGMLAPL